MGNFSGEFIMFMEDGGKPFEFTCEYYKRLTGFAMPRLYLLTRHEDEFEQDNPSEDNLMRSTFEENAASLTTSYSHSENDGHNETSSEPREYCEANLATSPSLGEKNGLIGTSAECQKYFEDVEKASHEAEKEKEKCREESKEKVDLQVRMVKEEAEHFESLRRRQELRVPLEPTSSNRVWVSVRHSTLGVLTERLTHVEQFQEFLIGSVRYPLHWNISV